MAKVRKAVLAAVSAAASVALAGLATEIPRTQAGWVALGTAALGAAFVAGYAVWRVPNTPA